MKEMKALPKQNCIMICDVVAKNGNMKKRKKSYI